MAAFDIGTAISVFIVIMIFGGLFYSFWKKTYITMSLVIVNFIIFFVWVLSYEFTNDDIVKYGVLDILSIRYDFFTDDPAMLYTLFSHMYLHFGIGHIIGNMIFLVLLGVPLEDRIGAKWFIVIYFITGVLASVIDAGFSLNYYSSELGQALGTDPGTYHIGASGAIFGILGAFVALYPRDKIYLPVLVILMKVPVWVGALAYGGFETIIAFSNPDDGIGHMVHIMGFMSGMVIATIFAKFIRTDDKETAGGPLKLENLKDLAKTRELRDIFLKIRDEDVPDIRNAWLEKFAETATCPTCRKPLMLKGRKIKCTNCSFSRRF